MKYIGKLKHTFQNLMILPFHHVYIYVYNIYFQNLSSLWRKINRARVIT